MMEEPKPSFIVRLGLGFLILFILSALLIPRVGNGARTNKIGKAKSDLAMICSAIDEFKRDDLAIGFGLEFFCHQMFTHAFG